MLILIIVIFGFFYAFYRNPLIALGALVVSFIGLGTLSTLIGFNLDFAGTGSLSFLLSALAVFIYEKHSEAIEKKEIDTMVSVIKEKKLLSPVGQCPKCNASLEVNSEFCSTCGARIFLYERSKNNLFSHGETEKSTKVSEAMFCHKCDAQLEEDSIFCSHCATRISL